MLETTKTNMGFKIKNMTNWSFVFSEVAITICSFKFAIIFSGLTFTKY